MSPYPPFPVLAYFAPHTRGLRWHRAPDGFSGAVVWCGGENDTARVALKAWPAGTRPERVRQVHTWLSLAAHLPFVPGALAGGDGHTLVTEADRVWDCCRWMPGRPCSAPTAAEVAAACAAVAQLHATWAATSRLGPCPGVQNRLRILTETEPILRAGPDALPPVSPDLDPVLRHALAAAARAAPGAVRALRPWEHRAVVLQPCVRDLRADHVLFEGGRVGGIIDYGAAGADHPAVDLARLLSDYAGPDDALFGAGLAVYRGVNPTFEATTEFAQLLARTGAVCSVLGWLVRLVLRREAVPAPRATAARIAALLARVGPIPHV
ncbi:phosphotransferase [Frigoriglobus tundricola]|uniref:Aminoglycoside phosphotransferase domain-containing protein n=1 Tax=Frigoriglobus tundricola TaxID=2774151 RepID=A0A6M5YJ16_9BACT|nr:phosphotransferase [Frigoriglobus tundricola]QJW93968.1 hypothetical protein FTUN_1485 [Frigoriglobus tundricola]